MHVQTRKRLASRVRVLLINPGVLTAREPLLTCYGGGQVIQIDIGSPIYLGKGIHFARSIKRHKRVKH